MRGRFLTLTTEGRPWGGDDVTIDDLISRMAQQAVPGLAGVQIRAPGPFGAVLYPLEDVIVDAAGTLRLVLGVGAAKGGTMLADIEALLAALQAHDWLTAFTLAIKVANEVLADLTKQGVQPHVVKRQYSPAADIDGLTKQLETEAHATAINWGNVLAIVAAIIKVVLPLILNPTP